MALEGLAIFQGRGLEGGGLLLWLSCPVPPPRLPLTSEELVEFPSYGLVSVKAQTLQAEVDKILEKGALEIVDPPGPGYYSRLFLVQKVTGGWRPVMDLSTFGFRPLPNPYTLQDGNNPRIYQEKKNMIPIHTDS